MMIIILFLTLSNIFNFNCAQHQTNLLADIVKSRCTHWKIEHGATNINCSEIWNSFENILISPVAESQCPMKPKSYDNFVYQLFELEQQQLQQQQRTIQTEYYFHSQVMEVIRGMCKRLGMCRSLETTLPGYLFDDLNWCNKTLTGMTNYGTSCGCDRKIVVRAYWESASAEFARRASGNVFVVLNGSAKVPFDENKTFGSIELPLLNGPRVKQVTVKLIHSLEDFAYRQTCESWSLQQLANKLNSSHILFRCIDDPLEFRHYQCIKTPYKQRCQFSASTRSSVVETLLTLLSLVICLTLYTCMS
ncbi:unnamed protein product [Schistosoma margrebowiei]|uniref:ADP-ribosyl cyclase/cyclic ADP-ribose hydrolase n=3 Tax=Schistosoma margrebowiei TaxID=48269 RepID=A0AA84ZL65_9TREM|nr:unnamed protein product [Schistosoma margrebowiei]